MKEKSNINNVKQLKIKIWKNQRRQTNKTLVNLKQNTKDQNNNK